MFAEKTLRLKI